MTYTIAINNCISTDSESAELICMPSRFTSIEANFLEKLFQRFYHSYILVQTDLENFNSRKIIVDFGQTTFMDKGGLIGLCKILRFAQDRKISLSFLNFTPQVKMILSLAGLEDFFMKDR